MHRHNGAGPSCGAAAPHPGVLTHPVPKALFLDFGDRVLNFEMRAWKDRYEELFDIRSELSVAVHKRQFVLCGV